MELQVIDIRNMTINQINNEIKRLENQLYYLLEEKERVFNLTQPKVGDTSATKVEINKREDKFANYVIQCEELDEMIEEVQTQKYNLVRFVENELVRIGEYDPLMRKIVELREVHNLTWRKVSEATNYSESQCRRIYIKYKNQRNI
jgi:hypothetical protein